jgi:hypothetical protein
MDVTIRTSRVVARRRHAAEKPRGSATFAEQEKRNDLAKAIAAAPAAAGTPVPNLSWDFQPLNFDQHGAPGESTLGFLEKLPIESPCARTGAPVLHYADSFGSSATAYGLTKLLLHWHDCHQRLLIRRLLCLLEYS